MKHTTQHSLNNALLSCSRTKDAIVAYAETADLPLWSQCFLSAQVSALSGALLLASQTSIQDHDDAAALVSFLTRMNKVARSALTTAKAEALSA